MKGKHNGRRKEKEQEQQDKMVSGKRSEDKEREYRGWGIIIIIEGIRQFVGSTPTNIINIQAI